MADYPPFMNAYGLTTKIFEKIKQAKSPERFTQDFLATKLGFASGSAKPFIPLLKRLGFVGTDGTPSDLYIAFRDPTQTKIIMAQAMRNGYSELFSRNEYANNLDKKKLEALIMEATKLEHDSPTLRAISGTFENLKDMADFESNVKTNTNTAEAPEEESALGKQEESTSDFKMGLSYTINLNLPKTDDIAVFNAIFKSLRENLLRN